MDRVIMMREMCFRGMINGEIVNSEIVSREMEVTTSPFHSLLFHP